MKFQRSLRGGMEVGAEFGKEGGFQTPSAQEISQEDEGTACREGDNFHPSQKTGENFHLSQKRGIISILPKEATPEDQIKSQQRRIWGKRVTVIAAAGTGRFEACGCPRRFYDLL